MWSVTTASRPIQAPVEESRTKARGERGFKFRSEAKQGSLKAKNTSAVQYLTDLWPLNTQYMKEQGQIKGLFEVKWLMVVSV